MRILGFDPGPTWVGWALIDCSNPSAPKWVRAGKVPALECARLLAEMAPGELDLVGVEVPSHASFPSGHGDPGGVVKRLRSLSSELIATALIAGRIIGMAEGQYSTSAITAQVWRQRLTSKVNASDATIKTTLAYVLRGMPTRSNAHERDAAGVALAAWKEARFKAMAAAPKGPRA